MESMEALRALLRPKLVRAKKLWAKPVLAVITLLRIMAVIKDRREASKRKRLTALFVGASVIGWARYTLRCRTLGRCRTLELPSPCYKPLTDEALGLSTASEDASEDPARRRQVAKRSRRTRIVESTGAEDEPPTKRVRINEPATMEEMRQTVLDLVNTEDEVTRHIYGLLKLYPVFRPFIDLRVSAERPTALHDVKSEAAQLQQQLQAMSSVTRPAQPLTTAAQVSDGQKKETIWALMEKHPILVSSLYTTVLPWKLVTPDQSSSGPGTSQAMAHNPVSEIF